MPNHGVWFGVIRRTLQNFHFTIFKTLLLSQFSFYSSKLYTRYPKHGAIQAITFLAICQKLKTKYGILKFFLTQDHVWLEISKCSFSHNFHWRPAKPYQNIGYHGLHSEHKKIFLRVRVYLHL